MDRASDLTDAFVEVKFGNTTFKTDVCPKSLNPQWNSEWFKFEVKFDLFNDLNRFRQSSCGVKFFCTTSIPRCYRVAMVHGFVEELVVNEDPEYQWIDRIRTPRASNEARQRLISLMSGELQRKIGLKVLEMGGNAVVGYLQCFDLEGESGLVVRAIGTACTLDKLSSGAAASINTHMHPNTAPASNACNSPSKDGKE
uniref:C2 calcium dependent domain containing 5 n=1 Tax=Myripristis murdjan TaxID=586833 RepID=A0A667YM44_9TELE